MKKIYYIGGSPCSGKSTAAKRLAKETGGVHFEADEYFYECILNAKESGLPYASKQADVLGSEKWMRAPKSQAEEELKLYEEIFPFLMECLKGVEGEGPIVAEGAAFLPNLMAPYLKEGASYACIVPGKEFQVSHYKERAWAMEVVKECKDPQVAFANWMERDHLFAKEVIRRANMQSVPHIIVDETLTCEEEFQWLLKTLGIDLGV